MAKKPIQKAVEKAGSQAALAAQIGVTSQEVWQWVNGYRPVPAKHCMKIETATGVTCRELLPEVFDPDSSKAA